MPNPKDTTYTVIPHELIVYRRGRSSIWQCRYKVSDTWVRASTKKRDLNEAKESAREIQYEAKIRAKNNLPIITRRFKHVADSAIARMEKDIKDDRGFRRFNDYVRVLKLYHIPYFGKYQITIIDYGLLNKFDTWRAKKMGKAPSLSTIHTHNAALNRVFDEAVAGGYLTESTRPTLTKTSDRGRDNNRRQNFKEKDLKKLLGGFDSWAKTKSHNIRKQRALLLKDYVCVLLDTGARPGRELMELRWNQIEYDREAITSDEIIANEDGTPEISEVDGEPVHDTQLIQEVWMTVTGKTGTRTILGNQLTIQALKRIAKRNYEVDTTSLFWLPDFIESMSGDDKAYVFRTPGGKKPTNFNKLFDGYLEHIKLPKDIASGDKYSFYCLRHTYATLRLTKEGTPIHTLAEHMGTSVDQIQSHYSHLKVREARDQLRGKSFGAILASYAS